MKKTILLVTASNSFSEGKRRILLMLLFLIAGSGILFSQDLLISGRVTDESGAGLPSVSIIVKGTTIGTLSNADGSYSIRANRNSVLTFSFVGMEVKEVLVTAQTTINVTMNTLMVGLDELVVIGYGTQSRAKVTTSIASVGSEKIEEVPVPTLLKGLQGKIAGVSILQQSGQPGSQPNVVIRGGSSITKSNAPLYIIDGFPRPIGDINPMDIESVDVLKDAAATSIYGARASNGVILITTKTGQKGKAAINFNYSTGFQEFGRKIETLTAKQYLEIMRPAAAAGSPSNSAFLNQEAPISGYNTPASTWTTRFLNPGEEVPEGWQSMVDPLDPTKTLVFQDNDLQEKLFRRARMSDYYLSVTGGTGNITTFTGIGYVAQEGIALETEYDRWSIRNNTSFALNSKVSINTNLDFTSSKTNQFENEANIFTRGVFNNRTIRDYFPDGTPGWGINSTMVNPEWYWYTRNIERRNQRATLGLGGDWEIINNLHFRPSGNYYFQLYSKDYFEKSNQFNKQRTATADREVSQSWQFEMLLQYDVKKLAQGHNLSILAGYSNLYLGDNNVSASAYGASTDNIPTLNAAPTPTLASSTQTEELLISQFGRVLYDFRDKYLFTASLRHDGSSKFGTENKYALFPSFSAGWIISKEPFMAGLGNLFSLMKLRLSYGQTGNNNIGRYVAQGVYGATYPYGGRAGIRATQMPNEDLRWEKTTQFAAGIDVRLFPKERIEFSFDYYYKYSDDLLISMQLPRETGFNTIEMNIGSAAYWGYEFALLTKNISNNDFYWNTEFNIAFTTNEVLKLPEREGIDKNRLNGTVFPDGRGVGGYAEGEKMGQVIGFVVDYLIDNDSQASTALYDERAAGWNPATNSATLGKKYPGDFEWVENYVDGRINDYDQFVIGYEMPHTTGGLTNILGFKGLELNIFTDFAIGHTINDAHRAALNGNSVGRAMIPTTDLLQAWKQPGDAAKTNEPRVLFQDASEQNNRSRNSDYSSYRADFLCIREVKLGYNVPGKLVNKIGIKSLKAYIAGNNLYYFTKFRGYSPDVVGGRIGHQDGQYPAFRTVAVGVNIGL